MKFFLFAVLAFSTLLSANATNQSPTIVAKPKIVGGELAAKGDWPWMSALVFTQSSVNSYLDVAGIQYASEAFSNGPSGQAKAAIIDCGIGENLCPLADNKICLIARGKIDFSDKVNNCQASGGIGAIIFNNASGVISGTLGADFSGTIPVIAISQDDGAILLDKVGSIATINISAPQTIGQSASCGATFIGEKWVLTAAHCVTDANLELLKVNIGEYDLSNGAENAKAIAHIYIHPEYNVGSSFNNDIALIELVETVNINQPAVTLVDDDTSTQLAIDNSAVTVIGWGNRVAYGPKDESPGNSQPNKLYQVELSLLSNAQCKDKLAQAYTDLEGINYSPNQVGITDSMICAEFVDLGLSDADLLANAKGSCQGDSGGPLLVNTNQGWQQLGIVSYGVGCAVPAFPEVYARVGKFTQWINSITKGIAIEPNYSFAITPQHTAQTTQLTVTNNSDINANLTFTLLADKIGSNGFSLQADNCRLLTAKQSCQLQVNFDAKALGQQSVRIVTHSNDVNIPTTQSFINAQAIALDNNINTQLSGGSSTLLWFSGGDQPWSLDNSEAAIISGNISDNQQSSVLLSLSGAGSLSFDWAVSSEENTDNPEQPFDALYLIIDGEQVNFISGEVIYSKVTIDDLAAGEHQITWLYKKDKGSSKGKDQGYLKNVIFTPTVIITAPPSQPPTLPTKTTTNKSGGGSIFLLLFILIAMLLRLCPASRYNKEPSAKQM